MLERRCFVIAFLVVATLLTVPTATAAQSTATQEPSASTSADAQQPTLVGATLETYYQFKRNRVPDRTVPLRAYDRSSDRLLVRAEYRRDASSKPFFPGLLGTADLRRTQPTALIGAIWVFGSKKGTW